MYERSGYRGVGIGGEPTIHNSGQRDLDVEYVGVFAGRDALENAATNLGGGAALLTEKDPVVRAMLSRKFPNAPIVADFDDEDWHHWGRSPTAALGGMAGPPCGPYAPTCQGRLLGNPRARYLLGVGTVACALQPGTIDIEALYGTVDDDGERALIKIDEVMDAADYRRLVPSDAIGVERVCAASLGSAVFETAVRTRQHAKEDSSATHERATCPALGLSHARFSRKKLTSKRSAGPPATTARAHSSKLTK